MNPAGYVYDVEDGIVICYVWIEGEEYEMRIPIGDVPECQRGYLERGAIFELVNDTMLISKELYTSKDIEDATKAAEELWKELGWGKKNDTSSD